MELRDIHAIGSANSTSSSLPWWAVFGILAAVRIPASLLKTAVNPARSPFWAGILMKFKGILTLTQPWLLCIQPPERETTSSHASHSLFINPVAPPKKHLRPQIFSPVWTASKTQQPPPTHPWLNSVYSHLPATQTGHSTPHSTHHHLLDLLPRCSPRCSR